MPELERLLPRLMIVVGGVLLLASLFLPWIDAGCYGTQPCLLILRPDASAWEAFRFADVLLALAVPAAFAGMAIADLFEWRWPYMLVSVVGGCAICLAFFAIYHPAGAPGIGPGAAPGIGFLGGILGAGGLTVGAILAAAITSADG